MQQGSVLGPLFFLIYINEPPLHVNESKIDLFADDTTVHKAAQSLDVFENGLNNDISEIQNWCNENQMLIKGELRPYWMSSWSKITQVKTY